MITNELLNNTPEDIAKFLLEEDGLNKTMIGDYLGEKYVLKNKVFCFPALILRPPDIDTKALCRPKSHSWSFGVRARG